MSGARFRRGWFVLAILAAALWLVRCDDHSSPTGPVLVLSTRGPKPTPTTGSGSGSPGAPPEASFAVRPPPGPDGVIHGSASLDVTFNLCPTVNPDPAHRELYFALDFFDDGTATHSGTNGSDCRFTFRYYGNLNASARVCVVDRDRVTHQELHEFQCATFRISLAGAFCHSVNAADASNAPASCPSGATEFCDTVPIVGTSRTQALAACDRCYGAGQCTALSPFDAESGPGPYQTSYLWGDIGAYVPICAGTLLTPGDITHFDCTSSAGRWAP